MAIAQSKRTHCPYGHEYTPENTYISGGRRICRSCSKRRWAERHPPPEVPSLIERVVTGIEIDEVSGCWCWQGRTNLGYATYGKPPIALHRFVYEYYVGPIGNLVIDHVKARGCRHRHCLNPDHLEPVTIGENVLRGDSLPAKNKRKTHCPQGHPYDEENTYVNPRTGWRLCRTCIRERARRSRRGGDAPSSRS